MKLQSGVTGFFHTIYDNPPPQVDEGQFKRLCFNVALSNGGKIIYIKKPQYPNNFYCALVEMLHERFYILLNEYYPYVAFASVVEFGYIEFMEGPEVFKQFFSSYQVLSLGELNIPLSQTLINNSQLNRGELKQIAYWKPEMIGQIIFNFWD